MRSKLSFLLLFLTACPQAVPNIPPTASIKSPIIVSPNVNIFLVPEVSSQVGIDTFRWEISSADSSTQAVILDPDERVTRLFTSGTGLVTVSLTVTDTIGVVSTNTTLVVKDRPFGRTQLVTGTQTDSSVGTLVFTAGDLNRDERDDAILSDPKGLVSDSIDSGFVEIFLGASTGGLNGEQAKRLEPPNPQPGEEFGKAVATGDFNGDGFRDIAIGRPGFDDSLNADKGQVLVFFGSANFFENSPVVIEVPTSDFGGRQRDDRFGESLAAADWSGDGIDDLAIAAPGRDRTEIDFSEVGEIYIYLGTTDGAFGSLEGNNIAPATIIVRENAEVGLGLPEGLGTQITAVPSVCGDARPDLIASAPGIDLSAAEVDTGAVLVFCATQQSFAPPFQPLFFVPPNPKAEDEFGASIISLGDVDLDEQSEFAISAPGREDGVIFVVGLPGSQLTEILPNPLFTQTRFGEVIASADLDGSGTRDLVIGLPDEGPGTVLIFPLSLEGVGEPLIIESPSKDVENFGRSLSFIGDANGDGLEDLISGTPALPGGGARLIF